MIFGKNDFGHVETGSGAKKRVVLSREILNSSEKSVWRKIRFLTSLSFTRGNLTLIFYYFDFDLIVF